MRGWCCALFWLVVSSGCSFEGAATPPQADVDARSTPGEPTPGGTVSVEVKIDGRSHLLLRDDTAQWLHFENAAPGRHGSTEPTTINGVMWLPTWPDQPNAENRDCDCTSDVMTGIAPPVPTDGRAVNLSVIEARDTASIIEQPAAGNDYTLVVELDDNARSGSDIYIVEIEIPDPP